MRKELTVFADEYFFSVARMAPLRAAALSADEPRTTVSRSLAPVRVLLPILVTWSQSDMIVVVLCRSCGNWMQKVLVAIETVSTDGRQWDGD